jgi:hypothetical protein
MWKGLPWYPIERVDCRNLPGITWLGDFRDLPGSWSERFDIVVFDPPHVTEAGRTSRYVQRFGTGVESVQHTADISHLYQPFLMQAERVLRADGIVLAKISDQVHRGRFQFQQADFIEVAKSIRGLTPCDYIVKEDARSSSLTGHNWEHVRHTRRAHSFWICVRKGGCVRRA